jgi:CubicO group peptidase (beta-lactamase class C family)
MASIGSLPARDEMEERLETWCPRYRVPGAAVAWMRDGETQSAAAGVTNINTRVPVTPDTLFQIGSITKVWTTTLIMQLVDEGLVDLDAPAVKYLPDLRFGDAPREITIRRLLSHTSGVDGDFFEDFGRGDDAVARYVEAASRLDQLFSPGEMWSYCNAGFVVLGRIIEVLRGTSWEDAFRARLVEPLGLERTVTLPEEALLHNTSAGHHVTPSLDVTLARPWHMPRSSAPAGATPCSTVADLLTFARMHVDGGVAREGTRILSETSVTAMREPQFTLPSVPGMLASHWGLGWMLFDWGGRRIIGHDGGTIGQASSLRILPAERFAVAVLTNSPGGGLLANRVMRWLFGQAAGIEPPPRAQPPDALATFDLAPYAGVYERHGFRTTVALADGALTAHTVNTSPLSPNEVQFPPSPLIPVEPGVFLQRDPTGLFSPVTFSGFRDAKPAYLAMSRVARRVGA